MTSSAVCCMAPMMTWGASSQTAASPPRTSSFRLDDRTPSRLLRKLFQPALDTIIENLGSVTNLGRNVLQSASVTDLMGSQSFDPRTQSRGVATLVEEGEQFRAVVEMEKDGGGAQPVVVCEGTKAVHPDGQRLRQCVRC